jgi:hypothetical protein
VSAPNPAARDELRRALADRVSLEDEAGRLRRRIVELRDERHSTNDALAEMTVAFRAAEAERDDLRAHVAELVAAAYREGQRAEFRHQTQDPKVPPLACPGPDDGPRLMQCDCPKRSCGHCRCDDCEDCGQCCRCVCDEPAEDTPVAYALTERVQESADRAPRAEDTADIVTLAPAQHAEAAYNSASRTIRLELTATPEQWSAWQRALDVDLDRTTHRGSCVTSHATWRGIHVVIRCWPARDLPETGGGA